MAQYRALARVDHSTQAEGRNAPLRDGFVCPLSVVSCVSLVPWLPEEKHRNLTSPPKEIVSERKPAPAEMISDSFDEPAMSSLIEVEFEQLR